MSIVDIGTTIMGAFTSTTSSLQNPAVGVKVQGGVIAKQFTSGFIETYYMGVMVDLGGSSIDAVDLLNGCIHQLR